MKDRKVNINSFAFNNLILISLWCIGRK